MHVKEDDENDVDEIDYEDESRDEWEDYKESMKEWKDEYKEILRDWKDKIRDWKNEIERSISSGSFSNFPMAPPIPPIPPMHQISTGRTNVVGSRIGDEDIKMIDMLVEAGVFSTRSEAVAYLVNEGIKARRDTFEKVAASLEEIRKTRKEAERQVDMLKTEIGLKESKMSKVATDRESCPKCGKQIQKGEYAFCPYCGASIEKK